MGAASQVRTCSGQTFTASGRGCIRSAGPMMATVLITLTLVPPRTVVVMPGTGPVIIISVIFRPLFTDRLTHVITDRWRESRYDDGCDVDG